MKFLLDQNLSPQTTVFLTNLGYDVVDVRQLQLLGVSDSVILQHAKKEERAVITFDADFANISEFPLGTHYGVIRLKIFPQILEVLHPILERELSLLKRENIYGCLVIIDNHRVRIRKP